VRRNRIHDVGSNLGYDHAIYVAHASDFQITSNWIYACRAGWGIHLYPDAQRGSITSNVIDGCGAGVTFSGQDTRSSKQNLFEHNIVTNSAGMPGHNPGYAVSGWFNSAIPVDNLARNNLFFANAAGDADPLAGISYTASGNMDADPLYIDPAARDYRLRPGSLAAGYGTWDGTFQAIATCAPRRRSAARLHRAPPPRCRRNQPSPTGSVAG
jgi:hypothetical protein